MRRKSTLSAGPEEWNPRWPGAPDLERLTCPKGRRALKAVELFRCTVLRDYVFPFFFSGVRFGNGFKRFGK